MARRRPTWLGIAALVGAADSRALAASPCLVALPQTPQAAPPRRDAAANDATANDAYNFIAGLFEKGFHDQAVVEATKFLKERPNYARAKEAEVELAKLEPTPAEFPYAVEVSFRLAQCALDRQDFAVAARRFDAIAGGDHYLAPAAAFNAGEAHFRAGAFAAAGKAYGKAADRKDAEYAKSGLHGLGWAHYKAGEFALAGDALQL